MVIQVNPHDELDLQERSKTTLPDQSARAAVWAALVSLLGLGLGSWLVIPLGLLGLGIGGLICIVTWAVSVGLAIGALRNHFATRDPKRLRRWAWGAIAIDAVVLALVVVFLWAVG